VGILIIKIAMKI